ncbi:DNA polymerase I [Candidatus Magnetaquicoccus inordinatus]|uniref:DNA polymerase I n=1 Tax=Candidatus Magnetaquicoccus inordinatus TaxID=2496818 RepID=UPI00187D2191|nr:DNA polymerase I [Candidatus Magnetaquicoccus inordinatus]
MSQSLFLIDASGYLYRAFYAVRDMSRRDGFPTNAIFGFVKMIHRLLDTHQPEHMVMVFDGAGPTKRHDVDANYKANRKSMPDPLRIQIPIIENIIQAWGIPCQKYQGYEADDLLGTISRIAEEAQWQVVIVSSDKDLMQLVSAQITLWDPAKEIWIREPEVHARWGVEPKKVTHVMALAGDSSDNIPGVPRIGDKIAAQLMQPYDSLEQLLSRLDEVSQSNRRQLLSEHADLARLSLQLVTIIRDVPLDNFSLETTRLQQPDWPRLRQLFLEMEFTTLVRDIDRLHLTQQPELPLLSNTESPAPVHYQIVSDWPAFTHFLQQLAEQPLFSLDTETTHLDAVQAELVGLSFSWNNRHAFYLPVGHTPQAAPHGQLPLNDTLAALKPLLEDENRKKIGQNIKYECVILAKYGIHLAGLHWDAMLLSHLLYGGSRRHNLDAIAMDLLQRTTITYKEVTGSGKNSLRFDQVALAQAAPYACEDAEVAWEAAQQLAHSVQSLPTLAQLYQTVELPLVQVLADMELAGICIDQEILADMSQRFTKQRQQLVEEIHALAGESFNVNSTQQLGEILFGKQKLPGGKRTKTGFSTDVEVLTHLAEQGHPLPERVLRYRSLTKLQTTYTDALPQLIHPGTGRLHTHFNQAATLTGRLSSSEPNLQNIPIRTEEGRAIRTAFIAPPGWVLLSADYSQIELRLLAHLGAVTGMQEAFAQDRDIHAATAAELFGGTVDNVSSDARRMAKTINFGLIYGMSPFGLAKRLGISNPQARAYMERYFQRYHGVREHMERTIDLARRQGYVETIAGRRCWLREIHSSDRTLREFAERTAINAPLQGSAADLIKMAMIRLHSRLRQEGWQSRMLLQVHDELVLEVPEDELVNVQQLVRESMEGVMQLGVPLKVDIGSGQSWAEAH